MGGEAKKILAAMGGDVKIPAGQKCERKVIRDNGRVSSTCKYPARDYVEKLGEYRCKFHDIDKVVRRHDYYLNRSKQIKRDRRVAYCSDVLKTMKRAIHAIECHQPNTAIKELNRQIQEIEKV